MSCGTLASGPELDKERGAAGGRSLQLICFSSRVSRCRAVRGAASLQLSRGSPCSGLGAGSGGRVGGVTAATSALKFTLVVTTSGAGRLLPSGLAEAGSRGSGVREAVRPASAAAQRGGSLGAGPQLSTSGLCLDLRAWRRLSTRSSQAARTRTRRSTRENTSSASPHRAAPRPHSCALFSARSESSSRPSRSGHDQWRILAAAGPGDMARLRLVLRHMSASATWRHVSSV